MWPVLCINVQHILQIWANSNISTNIQSELQYYGFKNTSFHDFVGVRFLISMKLQ
jgi:hypothetical protein